MTSQTNDRLLWLLLLGIGAFNKADFMLTNIAISEGYQEANPVINTVLNTWGFPFLKLLVVPSILIGLWMIRRRLNKRMYGYIWVGFIVYFMLMVHFKLLLFSGYGF